MERVLDSCGEIRKECFVSLLEEVDQLFLYAVTKLFGCYTFRTRKHSAWGGFSEWLTEFLDTVLFKLNVVTVGLREWPCQIPAFLLLEDYCPKNCIWTCINHSYRKRRFAFRLWGY